MRSVKIILNKIYSSKFLRFAVTGGLGTVTNLIVFFLISDLWALNSNIGSILAFIIAVTQNYFINHLWTFEEYGKSNGISWKDYLKFSGVSIFGLVINLIVLNLILYFFTLPLKVIAQAFGILTGFIFNYFGSRIFVFTMKKPD